MSTPARTRTPTADADTEVNETAQPAEAQKPPRAPLLPWSKAEVQARTDVNGTPYTALVIPGVKNRDNADKTQAIIRSKTLNGERMKGEHVEVTGSILYNGGMKEIEKAIKNGGAAFFEPKPAATPDGRTEEAKALIGSDKVAKVVSNLKAFAEHAKDEENKARFNKLAEGIEAQVKARGATVQAA